MWNAVTWHENNLQPAGGDISYSTVNVARHVERARAVIARHPGTVENGRIIVNEYGPSDVHLLAGWAVGYFRQFEDAGVQANRTCWNDFECGVGFDGLLTATGQPTALYWAHRAYADLDGGSPMAVRSSVPWQFDGLANRDDATQTVRVLVGRHWYCNAAVNGWCQTGVAQPAATANVTIEWPYGTAPVTATVTRMPAGLDAVAAPVPVSADTRTPANGELTVTLPAVADGDALSVVVTPASTTTTTTTAPPPPTTTTRAPSTTTTAAGGVPKLNAATVRAVAGPKRGAITITWAAAQPNGAPVTSYKATCTTLGLAPKSVTVGGSTLSVRITGLLWYRSYRCTLSATNKFGTSAAVATTPAALSPKR